MAKQKLRFLSAEDVKKALPMKQAVEAMKAAFSLLSGKRAIVPNRLHIETPAHNGTTLFMPSYVPKIRKMGLKVVSIFDDNPVNGLPAISALVILIDATNGLPLAIMEGASITALRTGAASGAATDLLARENAETAAIFGAGVQAETQFEAVCSVRKIKQALVFGRNLQNAKTFAEKMSKQLSIPVKIVQQPQDLKSADIICTATNASEPLFSDEHIKPGVHINAVGAYKPDMREVPGETVTRAKVIVDELDACMIEAGDILIPLYQGKINESHIYGELGEVASGVKKGRETAEEITFFKSVGNAVQDLVAAEEIFKAAEKMRLGREVDF